MIKTGQFATKCKGDTES